MKIKLFVVLILISVLASLAIPPAIGRAQVPGPSRPDKPGVPTPSTTDMLMRNAALAPENPATVALGAPSISYRYVKSFGHTDQAYYDDSAHFAYPLGVYANATGVWVAEGNGKRTLKFTSTGNFIKKFGIAGLRTSYEASEIDVQFFADMAEDSAGNLWVVDQGTRSILKFDSNGNFIKMLGEQWTSGSDNTHFNRPTGLALDGLDNLYIADTNNHRIQIYNASGAYLATIGVTGSASSDNAHLNQPNRLAIGGDFLYIADRRNHRIQIFNIASPTAPVYFATIGVSGSSGSSTSKLNNPMGVAVNASYIFVADTYNCRVQIFNLSTRAYLGSAGSCGNGDGQYQWPTDVAADNANNVWVIDNGLQRVEQYAYTTFVRHLGTANLPYLTSNAHYNVLGDVAAGPDGSLIFVENIGQRITKLNPNGTFAWSVGQPGVWGADNTHFDTPDGAAVDAAGNVYVADCWNHRVQMFNASGAYLATLGQTGTGGNANNQFDCPNAVAVDKQGRIFVVDSNNVRVQVFNANRTYLATIGVNGVTGSDNAHFLWPNDIDIAPNGLIYIVDQENHRVQVYNSSLVYQRTLGVSGSANSSAYDMLNSPAAVAVDGFGRVFIADSWGNHVHVYDDQGRFLTIIGDYWGNKPGELRQYAGLAVDPQGNLYGADEIKHTVDKWSPGLPGANGVPGWSPLNVNGMGLYRSWGASAMEVVSDTLFVGDITYYYGANVWKYDAAGVWTKVGTAGIGDVNNYGIDDLQAFKGFLYAGTWNEDSGGNTHGGQVWRHPLDDSANWEPVVDFGFGNGDNGEVVSMANFSNTLYAATWSWNIAHSAEIYRSTSGDLGSWSKVFDETDAGDVYNQAVMTMQVFGDKLYAATYNTHSGGKIWATSNGDTWSQANISGFGVISNTMVHDLQVFNNYLYASAFNAAQGGQVWRSSNGTEWTKVVDNGLTGIPNRSFTLESDGARLYLISRNWDTGSEVWVSTTGEAGSFTPLMINGWGAYKVSWVHWPSQSAVYNGDLIVSANAWSRAGWRAWVLHNQQIYLPIARK